MRIVQDSENKPVLADLIHNINRFNDYYCLGCFEKVTFVSKSERSRAHFRHQGNACHSKYSHENKMSDFHINWQSIFPADCLEIKIENHRADIFLKDINFNDLNIKCQDMVIEIQNSKISEADLLSREQTYRNNFRELLWIFNLNNCDFKIEQICLYDGDRYQLKVLSGEVSWMNLLRLNLKSHVMLDCEDKNLYYVDTIESDYVNVKIIGREEFLKDLSKSLNFYLEWNQPCQQINIPKYNYESIKNLPIPKKDEIRRCFYIMESIGFNHFLKDNYFIIVGKILSRLCDLDKNRYKWIATKASDKIMNIWIDWLIRNKPQTNKKMSFGKYKGKNIWDIPDDYINWLVENMTNWPNQKLKDEIYLRYDFQITYLKREFYRIDKNYTLGILINLVRQVKQDSRWMTPPIQKNYSQNITCVNSTKFSSNLLRKLHQT